MRRSVVFVILCICTLTSLAQSDYFDKIAEMKPWRAAYMNLSFGLENDNYKDALSIERMRAFAKNPDEIQRDLAGMEAEVWPVSAGFIFFVGVGLSPLNQNTGVYRQDREVRLGFGLHTVKEGLLIYRSAAQDTSIVYSNLQREFSLEGAYIRKFKSGRHGIYYLGLAASVGASYGNEMQLISGRYFNSRVHPLDQPDKNPITEQYDGSTVIYSRLSVPFSWHYNVDDKWSFGIDSRFGIGAQFVSGAPVNFIKSTWVTCIGFTKRI